MTVEVWLVRHGETEWSRSGQHTGLTDIPLTEEGEAAARRLRERLSVEFDLVISSPLQRARRTAELAGLTPTLDARAVEWDYGDYEGITSAAIREGLPDWTIWHSPVPGGESIEDVAARARDLLARVRAESATRAVIVSHGHFSRVLAATWLEQPPAFGARLQLGTTAVSVLGWERSTPTILHWNT